jgi:hypothetical protein
MFAPKSCYFSFEGNQLACHMALLSWNENRLSRKLIRTRKRVGKTGSGKHSSGRKYTHRILTARTDAWRASLLRKTKGTLIAKRGARQ